MTSNFYNGLFLFYKKPRPSDKLSRGFYIFTNLFYDFFSGLDSRELFVQVAARI